MAYNNYSSSFSSMQQPTRTMSDVSPTSSRIYDHTGHSTSFDNSGPISITSGPPLHHSTTSQHAGALAHSPNPAACHPNQSTEQQEWAKLEKSWEELKTILTTKLVSLRKAYIEIHKCEFHLKQGHSQYEHARKLHAQYFDNLNKEISSYYAQYVDVVTKLQDSGQLVEIEEAFQLPYDYYTSINEEQQHILSQPQEKISNVDGYNPYVKNPLSSTRAVPRSSTTHNFDSKHASESMIATADAHKPFPGHLQGQFRSRIQSDAVLETHPYSQNHDKLKAQQAVRAAQCKTIDPTPINISSYHAQQTQLRVGAASRPVKIRGEAGGGGGSWGGNSKLSPNGHDSPSHGHSPTATTARLPTCTSTTSMGSNGSSVMASHSPYGLQNNMLLDASTNQANPFVSNKSKWITVHFENGVSSRAPKPGQTIHQTLLQIGRLKAYHNKLNTMLLWKMARSDNGDYKPTLETVKLTDMAFDYAGQHLRLITIDQKIKREMRMYRAKHSWKKLSMWKIKERLRACRQCGRIGIQDLFLCQQCNTVVHHQCMKVFTADSDVCFGHRQPTQHNKSQDDENVHSVNTADINAIGAELQSHSPSPSGPSPHQVETPSPINTHNSVLAKGEIRKFFPGPGTPESRTPEPMDRPPGHLGHGFDQLDDDFIKYEDIKWGEEIGSGAYGTVFKCDWFGNVAVKKLNVCNPTSQQLADFHNEIKVLKKTRHDNILLFMGYCHTEKNELAIVTAYCESRTLYHHIHIDEASTLSTHDMVKIAKQIAVGMEYLHSKSIIHRDLKSPNVFLHEGQKPKIGDFGLATVKSRWSSKPQPLAGGVAAGVAGSVLWMAPEICSITTNTQSDPYTQKSDVYAFGIVLFEMFARKLPYSRVNVQPQAAMIILFKVGKGFLKPSLDEIVEDTPMWIPEEIKKCIEFERDERPVFRDLVQTLNTNLTKMPRLPKAMSDPSLWISGQC